MVDSSSAYIDPAQLPLPNDLLGGDDQADDGDYPVEHLSVIFKQKDTSEVLRISKKAATPLWLHKDMYTKLSTDIKFDLEPLDKMAL